MPIFDVQCPKCKTIREVFVLAGKQLEPQTCDICGESMEKKIGTSAIFLNGTFPGESIKRARIRNKSRGE